jgi:hypothetical protein
MSSSSSSFTASSDVCNIVVSCCAALSTVFMTVMPTCARLVHYKYAHV